MLADGRIYFAAGTWPFMGVFIHALDAETGEVAWTNSRCDAMYASERVTGGKPRPYFIGLAPQGYLGAVGDRLLVPCGRTKPACLDRRSGRLLYYHAGNRNEAPTSFVVGMGGYFFCSRRWCFELGTGRMMAMLGFPPVGAPGRVYTLRYGLQAYDLTRPPKLEESRNRKGEKRSRWIFAEARAPKVGADAIWLTAGSRLIASRGNVVLAADTAGAGRPAWQVEVDGRPHSVVAADGKLFVVTREGRIYCFGANKAQPRMHKPEPKIAPASGKWADTAGGILRQTGVTEGYCLVAPGGSPRSSRGSRSSTSSPSIPTRGRSTPCAGGWMRRGSMASESSATQGIRSPSGSRPTWPASLCPRICRRRDSVRVPGSCARSFVRSGPTAAWRALRCRPPGSGPSSNGCREPTCPTRT